MAEFTRNQLEQLICELVGVKQITPLITKHINELCLQYKMTWKEIARCLTWYVEVAHRTISVEFGIKTICTSVREKAEQYFKQLELDQQQQRAEAKKVVEYQENNIIFNIKSLKHQKRQPKQYDISDIDVDKGDS
jgi:hypothetical protein